MENASKALIIAGAILLSILIISLGIMIFNSAKGAANTDQLQGVEISSFNEQFTQYEGEKVRGAQVNSLISQIRNNNVTNEDRQVTLSFGSVNEAIGASSDVPKASTGKVYKVSCAMDPDTGLVNTVTITTPSGSNP